MTSSVPDFVVPVHTADLELPADDARFYVATVTDVERATPAQLKGLLDGAAARLLKGDHTAIVDNEVFDPLYSFLRFHHHSCMLVRV